MTNKKKKKEDKLLKTFIKITKIAIIVIIIFTAFSSLSAGNIDGASLSGFALLIPFFLIPPVLAFIWVIYLIAKIIIIIFKK